MAAWGWLKSLLSAGAIVLSDFQYLFEAESSNPCFFFLEFLGVIFLKTTRPEDGP